MRMNYRDACMMEVTRVFICTDLRVGDAYFNAEKTGGAAGILMTLHDTSDIK